LVSTLNLIIAQRLVRKLCEQKEEYLLSASEIKRLSKKIDMEKVLRVLKDEKVVDNKATWEKIPFYKAKQSSECQDGFAGRLAIYEVFKITPTIKEMVMKGATADEIDLQAQKEGMLTIVEDGIFKAVMGLTTVEEVLRVANE